MSDHKECPLCGESAYLQSDYEVTTDKNIIRMMELMGLHKIPADEVNLTPALLKR